MSRQSVEFSHLVKEQPHYSFCSHHCVHQNEVGSFGQRVHHYHDSIIPRGSGKFNHKVNTEGILLSFWDWDRMKLSDWRPSHRLCAKTKVATAYILSYVP